MNVLFSSALPRYVQSLCRRSKRNSLLNVLLRSAAHLSDKQHVGHKKLALEDKKRDVSTKIALLGKGTASITSLEEARKLSQRRNMMLVKIEDATRSEQRPIYKLLTTAEALSKDSTSRSYSQAKKQEKLLNIGSRIANHDLASRIKNISKWLQKGNEVRILIHGMHEGDPGIEKINKAIESAVRDVGGRIIHRMDKGGNIKFSILPPQVFPGVAKETA